MLRQKADFMSECSARTDTDCPISLKGTTRGFEILIESQASAAVIAEEIEAKLDEAPGFFKGGDVILRFDAPPPRGYLGPIEKVTDRYELRIVGVQGPSNNEEEARAHDLIRQLGLVEPVLASGSQGVNVSPESCIESSAPLAPRLMLGPVRSGCILEIAGHLIVLGDVNPGAEIRSTGSIIVVGRLRGIAHAGCDGASSFILALQLEPQQLRIGNLVARAGDSDGTPTHTEIAYAKDGVIMVDVYKGRLPAGIETTTF